jgi:hypothetical protein
VRRSACPRSQKEVVKRETKNATRQSAYDYINRKSYQAPPESGNQAGVTAARSFVVGMLRGSFIGRNSNMW